MVVKSKKNLYIILALFLVIITVGFWMYNRLEGNEEVDTINPPIEITSGLITSTELGFSWEDVENATSYLIFRDGIEIAEVEIIAFLDEDLEPGTTYTYQIKARSSNGVLSSLSETLTLSTADSDTAPPPPTNLHSMGETEDSIDLMWGASFHESGIKHYEIIRDGVIVTTTTETRYVDEHLEPETVYHYVIRAVANDGEISLESNEMIISTMEIGGIGHGDGGHMHHND